MTKELFNGYLREVEGIKGIKQLVKLAASSEDEGIEATRLYKKWYIVIRLMLQIELCTPTLL